MRKLKYCPYCGNQVKESDKFCIICGKPLVTQVEKSKKAKSKSKEEIEIPIEEVPEEETEVPEDLTQDKDEEKEEEEKKAKKEKEIAEPLPEDVKQQIELHLELNELQINKKILSDKLSDILKKTKDPDFEYDLELQDKMNLKLTALKKLIDETKKKEEEIKSQITGAFIVQKLNKEIDTKVFQLKNLTREHKLAKIDKKTFNSLKEKYKQEKSALEAERISLKGGIRLWVEELKLEKAEMEGDRKLNKGRYSAKEITKEEFQKKDDDFELKLKKYDGKIKTLEKLSK